MVKKIVVKSVENREVAVIEKKANPLIDKAKSQTVKNEEEKRDATLVLSEMNKVVDQITEFEEKVTIPLKAALKAETDRWKPFKTAFKVEIERIRGLLGNYQTAMVKTQKIEENKIANRVGDGKGFLKPETASRKIDEIEKPAEKVITEAGSLSFRTDKILKLTNVNIIPDDFWIIDEKKVLDTLKAGRVVPGAEVEEIQVPINRR